MKPRGTFQCAICQRPTTKLHELVPGRGNRQVCVDYNVQLPLCLDHHLLAHSPESKKWRTELFTILNIDEDKTVQAVHNKHNRNYLEFMKDRCGKKINSYLL